ncbi:hypothetical protein UPYG_G00201380 [Umbra pygmaea]|uniref:Uncharacterized protein n=1 Tax=Umbra pygmaea TaxID=75934 RepID=A0ABD0X0G0_UMBPY
MPKVSKAKNDAEVEPKRRSQRLSSKPTTPAKAEPKAKTPVKAAPKPKKLKVVEKAKANKDTKDVAEKEVAPAENGEAETKEVAAEVSDAEQEEANNPEEEAE